MPGNRKVAGDADPLAEIPPHPAPTSVARKRRPTVKIRRFMPGRYLLANQRAIEKLPDAKREYHCAFMNMNSCNQSMLSQSPPRVLDPKALKLEMLVESIQP